MEKYSRWQRKRGGTDKESINSDFRFNPLLLRRTILLRLTFHTPIQPPLLRRSLRIYNIVLISVFYFCLFRYYSTTLCSSTLGFFFPQKKPEVSLQRIRSYLVTVFVFYFQKLIFDNIKKKNFLYFWNKKYVWLVEIKKYFFWKKNKKY